MSGTTMHSQPNPRGTPMSKGFPRGLSSNSFSVSLLEIGGHIDRVIRSLTLLDCLSWPAVLLLTVMDHKGHVNIYFPSLQYLG